jgi:endonuclease/exonuclease/phosphatase (EEP) superfamily protein YafD
MNKDNQTTENCDEKSSGNILKMDIPLWWIPLAGIALSLLFFLLGYLGSYSRFCELIVNFRVQYALTAFVCSVIFLFIRKRRRYAVPGFMVFLVISGTLFPFYIPPEPSKEAQNLIRIMHINVHTESSGYTRVADIVLKNHPDILVLEEVDSKWMNELVSLKNYFRYVKYDVREDNFGIALFSVYVPETCEVRTSKSGLVPYIYANFALPRTKQFTVFALHTLPPVTQAGYSGRNEMLSEIAGEIRKNGGMSTVLIGDFNLTPWSVFFSRLEQESGLRNSQKGFGIQPSWPVTPPFLRIPIDHCLVSPEINVLKRSIGGEVGSDHFPLILDLQI